MEKILRFTVILLFSVILIATGSLALAYSENATKKIEELKIMSRDKKDMPDTMAGVKKITATELKSWIDQKKKFVLLDNRVPADYEKEHIKGAIRLSPDDLLQNPKQAEEIGLKKDDTIVFY